MKKALAFILIINILVTLGLVGCGSQIPIGTANADSGEGKGIPNIITIKLLAYNTEDTRKTYLDLLKSKFPNIVIDFQYVDQKQNANVLNTQLAAGSGPDLIETGGNTTVLANAGYLENLTSAPFISRYDEEGLSSYIFKGNVYAVPLQSWFEGIFYNKAIFKKYNIVPPKTFDEWMSIHELLKKAGIKPQIMGAKSWEPMMKQPIGMVLNEFYSTSASNGFDNAFNTNTKTLDGNWNAAIKEWSQMISKNYITKDMLDIDYDQALDEFATGKAAMWECGPWATETIKRKNPNLDFGMFPFPGIKKGSGWLIGGSGSAFAINSNSPIKDAVMQVLDFTSTPEAQIALIKDNKGLSFLKGVNVDLGPEYSDCDQAFKENHVYAPWIHWFGGDPIATEFGKGMQEVLAGNKTIDQVLKDTDLKAEQIRKAQN